MSFFDKMKASIGIGAAKVDARLDKTVFSSGETVNGAIHIEGGSIEQGINGIDLHLVTEVVKEVDDKKVRQAVSFVTHRAASGFTIGKGEKKTIPFSFSLPRDTPITVGTTRVWLQTALDISLALDPTDRDFITINPDPAVQTILQATESLGFVLRKVENIPFHRNNLGFVQEFEFKPTSGSFRGRLDEVEMVFIMEREGVRVLMEVDRKARGLASLLAESLDMDESKLSLFMPYSELNQGVQATASRLHSVIQSYS